MGEGWVTDALVRFGGEPTVTEAGDIVYVFPELMVTAQDASRALDPAPPSQAAGLVALGRDKQVTRAALQWAETPVGWSPQPGDRVKVTSIRCRRWGYDVSLVKSLVGREGTVAAKEHSGSGGLPFKVMFDDKRTEAYFSASELQPAPDLSLALQELEQPFSLHLQHNSLQLARSGLSISLLWHIWGCYCVLRAAQAGRCCPRQLSLRWGRSIRRCCCMRQVLLLFLCFVPNAYAAQTVQSGPATR